jgi:hypothetical protein
MMEIIKYFSATVLTSPELGEQEMREAIVKLNALSSGYTFTISHMDKPMYEGDVPTRSLDGMWILTGAFDKLLVEYQRGMAEVKQGYWIDVVETTARMLLSRGMEVLRMRVADGLEPHSNTQDIVDIVSDEMRALVERRRIVLRSSDDSRPQSIP